MKNNIDVVGILEWASKQGKSRERAEVKKHPEKPSKDLMTLLRERYDENRLLEQFFKDVEKLNKKDDKKEKQCLKLDDVQIQMALLVSFMFTAPIYIAWMLKYLH